MKPCRIILLGPPAAGKGTQGRLMMERWAVPVVSVGDLLRGEIASGTAIGQEAAGYMNHGGLVPDHVALAAVAVWLDQYGDDGFVFDGFPRTVGQAEALETILTGRNTPLTEVLWLELADLLIEQRVSLRVVCADCGRSFQVGGHVAGRDALCPVCGGTLATRHDDDPEKLATRMIAYRRSTVPLIAYYEHRQLLYRIDASLTTEEVYAQIVRARNQSEKEAVTIP